MEQATGLLSKISEGQFRLLTMNEELLVEGNVALEEGFHSDINLSNMVVRKTSVKQIAKSGIFNMAVPSYEKVGQCDCSPDCECECSVPDDCSNPNDCDCDCAEP